MLMKKKGVAGVGCGWDNLIKSSEKGKSVIHKIWLGVAEGVAVDTLMWYGSYLVKKGVDGWVVTSLNPVKKEENGVTHKFVGIVERAAAGRLMWWGSYPVKKWGGWVGIVCGGWGVNLLTASEK